MEMLQQMFQGIEVRAVEREGEFWFIATDVARALEIGNSRQAVARLDEDEKGVISTDTLGGAQEVAIVSESGLYSLILGSRKAEAKVFKRWVTHDLLPTLRRTGFYSLREPVITATGIARAYARPLSTIPVWIEHYDLRPAGYAENPDTGKATLVYHITDVQAAFGGEHRSGTIGLRPYSGAWETGPIPQEKLPLSARERGRQQQEENRRVRAERDRAEEERLARKPLY